MPNENIDLPVFARGDRLLAEHLNTIVRAIAARFTAGPGITIAAFQNQVAIGLDESIRQLQALTVMSVASVEQDHLLCNPVDRSGTVGSGSIKVLLPYTLRRTPFEGVEVNGETYSYNSNTERVADDGTVFQITPDYWVGALILVTRQNLVVDISGDAVTLIDNNNDSRTWAKVP